MVDLPCATFGFHLKCVCCPAVSRLCGAGGGLGPAGQGLPMGVEDKTVCRSEFTGAFKHDKREAAETGLAQVLEHWSGAIRRPIPLGSGSDTMHNYRCMRVRGETSIEGFGSSIAETVFDREVQSDKVLPSLVAYMPSKSGLAIFTMWFSSKSQGAYTSIVL